MAGRFDWPESDLGFDIESLWDNIQRFNSNKLTFKTFGLLSVVKNVVQLVLEKVNWSEVKEKKIYIPVSVNLTRKLCRNIEISLFICQGKETYGKLLLSLIQWLFWREKKFES